MHDRMTLASYLKLTDLMQELKPHLNEQPLLDRVTDPQLFILPSSPHPMSSAKSNEDLFAAHFAKIRNSKIVPIEGDHFDLVLPN